MGIFNLILLNARSMCNKLPEFENEILGNFDFPEFIAVTETWFSEIVSSDIFTFEKYTVYRKDRQLSPHGGVMFLARRRIVDV